jgi:hypothetical protein
MTLHCFDEIWIEHRRSATLTHAIEAGKLDGTRGRHPARAVGDQGSGTRCAPASGPSRS